MQKWHRDPKNQTAPIPFVRRLVVEQPRAGKRHGDPIFIADFDDVVVAHRPAGLCDVLHAAAVRPLHVVAEGEECVRPQRNAF